MDQLLAMLKSCSVDDPALFSFLSNSMDPGQYHLNGFTDASSMGNGLESTFLGSPQIALAQPISVNSMPNLGTSGVYYFFHEESGHLAFGSALRHNTRLDEHYEAFIGKRTMRKLHT